jgi:hypothetical protein
LIAHGLSATTGSGNGVLETTVRPDDPPNPLSSFEGVSRALGSPPLAGSASLGALWAANPDLAETEINDPAASSWARGCEVDLGAQSIGAPTPGVEQDPNVAMVTTGGWVQFAIDLPGETAGEVKQRLSVYPTLQGASPYGTVPNGLAAVGDDEPVTRIEMLPGTGPKVLVGVPTGSNESTFTEYWRAQESMCSFVEVSHETPHTRTGLVLPKVGSGSSPEPLMLWWALLLGLSSIARYDPALWTRTVDPDASTLAVGLERVLDIADARVPERILASLQAA